jgi:hypothetical protein
MIVGPAQQDRDDVHDTERLQPGGTASPPMPGGHAYGTENGYFAKILAHPD